VTALLVGFLLQRMMLGRHLCVGGNGRAERAGFRSPGQFFIYGFVGLLSSVAGVVHACTVRNANPFDLVGMELLVIAAVVLGGQYHRRPGNGPRNRARRSAVGDDQQQPDPAGHPPYWQRS
jgi:ribose/xylose/arabinose/galactoside ABC-type transport system permease subunit